MSTYAIGLAIETTSQTPLRRTAKPLHEVNEDICPDDDEAAADQRRSTSDMAQQFKLCLLLVLLFIIIDTLLLQHRQDSGSRMAATASI